MSQLRERYHFIHNVFANFYSNMLEYFTTYLYPRFEYRVVGTYDKSVEYINKMCQYDRETDKPMLPALILNPSGEFGPADANAGGMQLWRYPNLAPTMVKRLFTPIYRDQNLMVNAGFLRIKGEIELIMLLNSFYEYCDLRMLHINMFGGLNRIIYPQFFSSFIILPESFVNYVYTNPYTHKSYQIDWASADASTELVRSTARNELVLPLNIKPQISLINLADASNRYGGTDNIAEWKLSSTINYEIEIPNYLIIESDYLAEGINFEFRYGSVYSAYNDYQPPEDRMLLDFSWDWGLNSDTNTPDKLDLLSSDATCVVTDTIDITDGTSISVVGADFTYKIRYFHEVTAAESAGLDSTSDLVITLPEQIIYPKVLIVNSADGAMNFEDHYYITDNGWTLVIRHENVTLQEGWILELYVYKLMGT